MHEMDHLKGDTILNWKNSEGEIEVIKGKEEENKHFISTIEFYKLKIEQMRQNFPEMFEDNRKYTIEDGWKIFDLKEENDQK